MFDGLNILYQIVEHFAMGFKRFQYTEILERINEPRGKMQVIVGPRQVGKTTLVGQVLEECTLPYDSYSADDVTGVSADWLAQVCRHETRQKDCWLLMKYKKSIIGVRP